MVELLAEKIDGNELNGKISMIVLNYSSTDQVKYGSDRVTNEYYSKEENNVARTGFNF